MSVSPERDTVEFTSGMLLGAVLGAGLAFFVSPSRTPRIPRRSVPSRSGSSSGRGSRDRRELRAPRGARARFARLRQRMTASPGR